MSKNAHQLALAVGVTSRNLRSLKIKIEELERLLDASINNLTTEGAERFVKPLGSNVKALNKDVGQLTRQMQDDYKNLLIHHPKK